MLINTYIISIILHKEFKLSENRGNFKTLLCKVKRGASPGGNTELLLSMCNYISILKLIWMLSSLISGGIGTTFVNVMSVINPKGQQTKFTHIP
jgi:hypothetical protein